MPSSATLLDTDSATRLRVVIGRLSRQLRSTPSGLDAALTPTRISLMLSIDHNGPVRLSELADSEGINPTMLSRSVTQLVDAGLVTRTSDSADRRAAWVTATDAGHTLAERMRQERTDAVNAALSGLSASDRRMLEDAIGSLEALAAALKDGHR
ncbi:MAG TPA: MarR family transcriptional regulator [Solirubrobacteraceae bacterium]|jgi:DNA-binding MarR family transcriptional regulator